MTKARIYQPSKNAMQSGRAKSETWILEMDVENTRFIEPLMGWTGARDTNGQVKVNFSSQEEAISFAKSQGLEFSVKAPKTRKVKPKSYADNFKWDRVQ